MSLSFKAPAKRGDTLIEVMFAVGFFALVAIISFSVMNSGINNAERDLELVTARNELNAQAEALRFIHSSYISEKTLDPGKQQYRDLWDKIIDNAISPATAQANGFFNLAEFNSCDLIYDTPAGAAKSPLQNVNAFVVNTRKLVAGSGGINSSYISIGNSPTLFRPTELSSRIIFSNSLGTSDDQMTDSISGNYFNRVSAVEGIWDFAVTDGSTGGVEPNYYDFYIQTCWYGPRANSPTVLDTVIRLYNPNLEDN